MNCWSCGENVPEAEQRAVKIRWPGLDGFCLECCIAHDEAIKAKRDA